MSVVLRTDRLHLRPFETEDLEAVWEYAGDPDIRYMIFFPHESMEETARFIEAARLEVRKEKPQYYEFAMILKGRLIGAVTLWMETEASAEIGWILNKRYRGFGYVTEAAQALLKFAENELGISSVFACCDVRNAASVRVMENLGMEFEREQERLYERTGETAREYRYVWQKT